MTTATEIEEKAKLLHYAAMTTLGLTDVRGGLWEAASDKERAYWREVVVVAERFAQSQETTACHRCHSNNTYRVRPPDGVQWWCRDCDRAFYPPALPAPCRAELCVGPPENDTRVFHCTLPAGHAGRHRKDWHRFGSYPVTFTWEQDERELEGDYEP